MYHLTLIPLSEVQKKTGAEFVPYGTMGMNLGHSGGKKIHNNLQNIKILIIDVVILNMYTNLALSELNSDDLTIEEDIP